MEMVNTYKDNSYNGEDQDCSPLLLRGEGLEVPRAGFRDIRFFLFKVEEVLKLFREWAR
jgi:hypothetical protein